MSGIASDGSLIFDSELEKTIVVACIVIFFFALTMLLMQLAILAGFISAALIFPVCCGETLIMGGLMTAPYVVFKSGK